MEIGAPAVSDRKRSCSSNPGANGSRVPWPIHRGSEPSAFVIGRTRKPCGPKLAGASYPFGDYPSIIRDALRPSLFKSAHAGEGRETGSEGVQATSRSCAPSGRGSKLTHRIQSPIQTFQTQLQSDELRDKLQNGGSTRILGSSKASIVPPQRRLSGV